jgi:ornithine decarboxylase
MNRLETFVRDTPVDGPTVFLDTNVVRNNYRVLSQGLGKDCYIHYAMKANPNRVLLNTLRSMGCRFDAASAGEIDRLLSLGVDPDHISFGNTVKKPMDIDYAYQSGIGLFAADAREELEKIAKHAPGSQVFIRMLVSSTEAEWPLSRKFGCASGMVQSLMDYATELHLVPVGVSFHVGSQARHPYMWLETLDTVATVWSQCRAAGHDLFLLNIGGGFPAFYGDEITEPGEYSRTVRVAVDERFEGVDYLMAEPGRGLVGNAGMISAEVLLVSHKHDGDPIRWVYLDVGKFNGLAETAEEAIRYQFIVPGREMEPTSPCVMAGPSCDSADVLYEINHVELPVGLKSGDRILIPCTGAYTTTYSTVWFNGFEPLTEIVLDVG